MISGLYTVQCVMSEVRALCSIQRQDHLSKAEDAFKPTLKVTVYPFCPVWTIELKYYQQ